MMPSNSTIASVGLGVPVAVIVAWALNTFAGIGMPGEVQAALGAIVSAGTGFFFNGGQAAHTEG